MKVMGEVRDKLISRNDVMHILGNAGSQLDPLFRCGYDNPSLSCLAFEERLRDAIAEIKKLPDYTFKEDVREELADYAHEAWSRWMKYMFKRIYNQVTGEFADDAHSWMERWATQVNTPYEYLTEEEKESDCCEADKMLAIISGTSALTKK